MTRRGPARGLESGGFSRWIWRLASAAFLMAWMGFIFYLSSLSPGELPKEVEVFFWLGKMRDVVGHLFLYGVLGTLSTVALVAWMHGATRQARWTLVAAALGVLYGVLDEYHQSFVPGRSATAFDVLVDTGGIALGLVFAWYVVGMVTGRRIIPNLIRGWTGEKETGISRKVKD